MGNLFVSILWSAPIIHRLATSHPNAHSTVHADSRGHTASGSSAHLALVVVEHQPSLKVVSECAHCLIAEEVLEEGGGAARLPQYIFSLLSLDRHSL